MDWDTAIKTLADNGCNAIFPNMLWGGVAYYKSAVLPVAPEVRGKGDQIELCLAACRKYGVQCHIWKVNWNMGQHVPKEFVARMKEQGRTQVHFDGSPNNGWLCPSHPDNQKLEIDSMVEVANRYAVDGIHFDYIRYPDESTCFCQGCRERFERKIGRRSTTGLVPSARTTNSSSNGPSSAATTSPRWFRESAPGPQGSAKHQNLGGGLPQRDDRPPAHGSGLEILVRARLAGFRLPDGLHSPRHGICNAGQESARVGRQGPGLSRHRPQRLARQERCHRPGRKDPARSQSRLQRFMVFEYSPDQAVQVMPMMKMGLTGQK